MPKTTVNKHRKATLKEEKIWCANYICWMLYPTSNIPPNQYLFNRDLSGSIPAVSDFRHQRRPLRRRERVDPSRRSQHLHGSNKFRG
jgi:hypothetical protein